MKLAQIKPARPAIAPPQLHPDAAPDLLALSEQLAAAVTGAPMTAPTTAPMTAPARAPTTAPTTAPRRAPTGGCASGPTSGCTSGPTSLCASAPFSAPRRARHAPAERWLPALQPPAGSGPSADGFAALVQSYQSAGGVAHGELLGQLLEAQRRGGLAGLARLIIAGRVLAFEWRNAWWVPLFQLEPNSLAVKSGAQAVQVELTAYGSRWASAIWWVTPHARLDGRRPVDMVAADRSAVLDAACRNGVAASQAPWPALDRVQLKAVVRRVDLAPRAVSSRSDGQRTAV